MRKKNAVKDSQVQGTKDRIRLAALKEFAEKGMSGARVDAIAKEANVNIRMIYYFFGSKEGLLDAVLNDIFLRRKAQLVASYDDVGALLTSYFDGYSEDPRRVRLLQWEALQAELPAKFSKLTNFADRRDVIHRRIASIAELQRRGMIPEDVDPEWLYLIFVALAIYPMAFPQSVFITTGMRASSQDFKEKYREVLQRFGGALFATKSKGASGVVKAKPRRKRSAQPRRKSDSLPI